MRGRNSTLLSGRRSTAKMMLLKLRHYFHFKPGIHSDARGRTQLFIGRGFVKGAITVSDVFAGFSRSIRASGFCTAEMKLHEPMTGSMATARAMPSQTSWTAPPAAFAERARQALGRRSQAGNWKRSYAIARVRIP